MRYTTIDRTVFVYRVRYTEVQQYNFILARIVAPFRDDTYVRPSHRADRICMTYVWYIHMNVYIVRYTYTTYVQSVRTYTVHSLRRRRYRV